MANKCINCDKGVMYGHNVSHAKNRTNRAFKPNLHSVRVQFGTNMKRVKLCTKCLRMVKKATGQKKETQTQAAPAVATA